jgi:hypothetical protein
MCLPVLSAAIAWNKVRWAAKFSTVDGFLGFGSENDGEQCGLHVRKDIWRAGMRGFTIEQRELYQACPTVRVVLEPTTSHPLSVEVYRQLTAPDAQ